MIPRQTDVVRRAARGLIDSKPSLLSAFAWAFGLWAASTGLRLAFDPLFGFNYPYITYFLAVALAAGLGGFRAGILALVFSMLSAWWFFLPPRRSFELEHASEAVGLLVFAVNASVGGIAAAMLRTALWQLSVNEHRQFLLVQELNHRVKNNLATVQALARQSAKGASGVDAFLAVFEDRLAALGRTHELLARTDWRGLSVVEVVAGEIEPYASADGRSARIVAEGPDIWLSSAPAVSLGMIVHELATNSAKYGALSAQGRVNLSWRLEKGGRAVLLWREEGGPPVRPASRTGFGTRLIERLARSDLRGSAEFDYRPEGLAVTVAFAAESGSVGASAGKDQTQA